MKEHNSKLRNIFLKLHEYHLKIEPEKCEFLKEELSYLEHAVTAAGVKPDSQKMATVVELLTPRSQTGRESFLGMTGNLQSASVS